MEVGPFPSVSALTRRHLPESGRRDTSWAPGTCGNSVTSVALSSLARRASGMPDLMSSSTVKSAERLLDVLDLLARHARPVPTMTIARECDIPKSSAHHLLNVMRARHFVSYYEVERAWGLGVAAFEIGPAYLRSRPLQRMGRHLLVELTQRTGETSHLAMLHGTEVLYVDKEQPVGAAAKLVTEVGVRLPAHLTAVGRAILAELPESQVEALFA